jgi:hypothetical protein
MSTKWRAEPIALFTMLFIYLSLQFLSPTTTSVKSEEYIPFIEKYHAFANDNIDTEKDTLLQYLDDVVLETPKLDYIAIDDPLSKIESWEKLTKRKFHELNTEEKAILYADEILPQLAYSFQPLDNIIYIDIFREEKYMQQRLEKWEQIKHRFSEAERHLLGLDADEWFLSHIKSSASKKRDFNVASSNSVHNVLSHFKIFSSVFLKNSEEQPSVNILDACSKTSSKLLHWMSGELPAFQEFDAQHNLKPVYPIDANNEMGKKCFIKLFQQESKGRGIVFTANDQLVPELAAALSLLRISGNEYPIQIFYSNDLSEASMNFLNKIASEEILLTTEEIQKYGFTSTMPTQELTFADVSHVIAPTYQEYYTKYGMKLLAYLFNTFEEMIILDTDTVFFKPISHFFDAQEYQETGAYFFKDRDIRVFSFPQYADHIRTYLNGRREERLLDIPHTKNDVLNNNFFGKHTRHLMESGLFTIDRKHKFDGVLLATLLPMLKMLSSFSHGDKELIWLAQAIAGNDFSFNKISSVSVGELSMNNAHKASEICSTHPAHISTENELLWMNSGFFTCKKWKSYERDSQLDQYRGIDPEEIKAKYLSPFKITHAIAPPSAEYFVISDDNEPIMGWQTSPLCYGYTWCAYDRIGGAFGGMKIKQGELISFTPEQTETWSFMGKVWVDSFNRASIELNTANTI